MRKQQSVGEVGKTRVHLPTNADGVMLDVRPYLNLAGLREDWWPYAEYVVGDLCNWRAFHQAGPDDYLPHAHTNFEVGVPEMYIGPIKNALQRPKGDLPPVFEDNGRYRFTPREPDERGECLEYRLGAEFRAGALVPKVIDSFSLWNKWTNPSKKLVRLRAEAEGRLTPLHRELRERERAFRLTGVSAADPTHPIVPYMTGQRERWFKPCYQGRVHHPTGCCPAAFRHDLRVGDSTETLFGTDVSSSQVLLLAVVVGGFLKPNEVLALEARAKDGRGKRRPPSGHRGGKGKKGRK